MSDRVISFATAVNAAIESATRQLYTCAPAKVVKWDASLQRANCQILVKFASYNEEDEREVESWAVVPGVPVQFLGAGGFRITCPIEEGTTTGTLFFSHLSLDKWLTGDGGEVDPEFDHAHALTDAIFIPGLMPFGAPWESCSTSEMTIGSDSSGNGRIHFQSSAVLLGEGATKGVAREGDAVNLGQCYVTMGAGAVTAVFINGVQLPIGSDPAPDRGSISGSSSKIKAVD